MMHDEQIIWCQECINEDTPETWRDVTVPVIQEPSAFPATRKQRNVTVSEWGEILRSNGMVGVYRAYTERQHTVDLIIIETKAFILNLRESEA